MSSTVSFAYVDEAWGAACAPPIEKRRKQKKAETFEKNHRQALPQVYDDIMETYMQPCTMEEDELSGGNNCYGPLLPPRKAQTPAQECRQFDPSYNDITLLEATEMPYQRFYKDDNMFYNNNEVAEESYQRSRKNSANDTTTVYDEMSDAPHAVDDESHHMPQYLQQPVGIAPSSRVYTQGQVFDLIAYLLSGILLIVILEQILRIGMALRFS